MIEPKPHRLRVRSVDNRAFIVRVGTIRIDPDSEGVNRIAWGVVLAVLIAVGCYFIYTTK